MTTYYVGGGGSDAADGLSWANRKLTLNGAEDIPVVAGDTAYVAPGVYRELLTCDVSGAAGNPITYIGDVSGANTDGVGGTVRITGSNDDLVATRANCITATARSYRTFRGFLFDATTNVVLNLLTTSGNWIIEDCEVQGQSVSNTAAIAVVAGVNVTLRRCVFIGSRNYILTYINGTVVDNTGHLVENCFFLAGTTGAVNIQRIGGITFRNNLFIGGGYGIRLSTAITVGQVTTVNNNIFAFLTPQALACTTAAEMVEDYNAFWGNVADRSIVAVGANSVLAPPVFAMPQLLAGFVLPGQALALSEWSPIRVLVDSGPASDDLYGMVRPVTSGKRSWGPIQWADQSRSSTQAHAGSVSLRLADAGRTQMLVPVSAVSMTFSAYVYREANYAGTGPQLVVKQQGQADQTVTDAAAAGQWNLLTVTFTPAALPTWATVELVSNNSATSGSYATYFDDLTAA